MLEGETVMGGGRDGAKCGRGATGGEVQRGRGRRKRRAENGAGAGEGGAEGYGGGGTDGMGGRNGGGQEDEGAGADRNGRRNAEGKKGARAKQRAGAWGAWGPGGPGQRQRNVGSGVKRAGVRAEGSGSNRQPRAEGRRKRKKEACRRGHGNQDEGGTEVGPMRETRDIPRLPPCTRRGDSLYYVFASREAPRQRGSVGRAAHS